MNSEFYNIIIALFIGSILVGTFSMIYIFSLISNVATTLSKSFLSSLINLFFLKEQYYYFLPWL